MSVEAFSSLGSMEGIYAPIVEPKPAKAIPAVGWGVLVPGFVASGLVTLVAYVVHELPFAPFRVVRAGASQQVVSAAMAAIVLGVLLRNLLPLPKAITPGNRRIIKRIIPIAIVLLGAGLNLALLATIGLPALLVTALSLVAAIFIAYYAGRALGLAKKTALLVGVGTGVCGNSAIAAVAPLVEADDDDLVLSIGTINLFGLLAMLAVPFIAVALSLSAERSGVLAGSTIHAVPQVAAAGFQIGPEAGAMATLTKLVRVAMLAPLIFVLALIYARHHAKPEDRHVIVHYARFVPWFVWGFIGLAALSTLQLLPVLQFPEGSPITRLIGEAGTLDITAKLTWAGKLLLTLAMAAIGLEVNIRLLASVSWRAVVCGLIAAVGIIGVSLGLMALVM